MIPRRTYINTCISRIAEPNNAMKDNPTGCAILLPETKAKCCGNIFIFVEIQLRERE